MDAQGRSHETAAPAQRATAAKGGKFLTFVLADEEFGIEILKVQAILGMMTVTHLPRTPAFILGVVNLRGKIIPVIDLRQKLSMPPAERTENTCVVVVQVAAMEIGVVVDRVCEVASIASSDIEDAPAYTAGAATEYIIGIGKSQSKVRLLLDIEKTLSRQEMEHVGEIHRVGDGSEEQAAAAAAQGKKQC